MAKFEKFLQEETKDHHLILTQKIIEKMEESLKYEKPWLTPNGLAPYNPVTGTKYKGVNFLSLMLHDFNDDRFYTFNNIKKLAQETNTNIHIKKGEKGIPIFKALQKTFTKTDKESGEESVFGFWTQVYSGTVFNATQIEGLPALEKQVKNNIQGNEAVTQIIEALAQKTGLTVLHKNIDRACYIPLKDTVELPEKDNFKSNMHYLCTALHETSHATGHKSRLNRDLMGKFGTPEYAKEELIAELASYFLGTDPNINIPYDSASHDNHAAYLQSWLKALKNDKNYIFKCASAASKVAEYQLSLRDEYLLEIQNKSNKLKI